MTIVQAMRQLGIEPAVIKAGAPEVNLMQAGGSLTFAQNLHTDLLRGNIGNFNVSRPDGTPIVSGCSDAGWRATRDVALARALAYLEAAEAGGVILPPFPAVADLDGFFESYDNAAFRATVRYKAELPSDAPVQMALV